MADLLPRHSESRVNQAINNLQRLAKDRTGLLAPGHQGDIDVVLDALVTLQKDILDQRDRLDLERARLIFAIVSEAGGEISISATTMQNIRDADCVESHASPDGQSLIIKAVKAS